MNLRCRISKSGTENIFINNSEKEIPIRFSDLYFYFTSIFPGLWSGAPFYKVLSKHGI